jgi:hypothetical protein
MKIILITLAGVSLGLFGLIQHANHECAVQKAHHAVMEQESARQLQAARDQAAEELLDFENENRAKAALIHEAVDEARKGLTSGQ